MLYFHSYKTHKPLVLDIVQDIRRLNDMSVKAKRAGMIILGGGVCKHQIANAMLFVRLPLALLSLAPSHHLTAYLRSWWNPPGRRYLQRNGADYAVYINTGQEYDGSDSGARPDEAVSWGKIKADARMVKVSPSLLSSLSLSRTRSIRDSGSKLIVETLAFLFDLAIGLRWRDAHLPSLGRSNLGERCLEGAAVWFAVILWHLIFFQNRLEAVEEKYFSWMGFTSRDR
jgi:hypothetical protein